MDLRERARWTTRAGVAAVLTAAAAIYSRGIEPRYDMRSVDAATYIQLGAALGSGEGYVESWTPGYPPHTQFPPLFPAAIAGLHLLGGSFAAYHAIVVWCGFLALFLAWMLIAKWTGEGWALLAVAALAVTPPWVYCCGRITTDVPFAALACGALLLVRRAGSEKAGVGAIVAAAAATGAATLLRTIGVALLPAGFLALWCAAVPRPRRRAALFLVLASLPLAIWTTRNLAVGNARGTTYVGQLLLADPLDVSKGSVDVPGLVDRVAGNAVGYARLSTHLLAFDVPAKAECLVGRLPEGVSAVFYLFVAALPALGAWTSWRRSRDPGAPFLLAYVAIVLAWPWTYDRFLVPVFPLLLGYALLAAGELARQVAPRLVERRKAAIGAAVLLALLWGVPRVPRVPWVVREYLRETPELAERGRAYDELYGWLRAGGHGVVLTREPALTNLMTRYPSVAYERTRDPKALDLPIERYKVRWILVGDDLTRSLLGPTLARSPDRFPVVFRSGPLVLHAVVP